MAWFNLAVNLAGLFANCAVLVLGIRLLRLHARGEDPDSGGSRLLLGAVLVLLAIPLAVVWGWPSAHGLWINIQAPARLWPTPPMALAGPEIFMGGTTTEEVRSFSGEVELYATRVTVLGDGNDLIVHVDGFEALKRSRSFHVVMLAEIRARVLQREMRRYADRRGSAYGLVLHKLAESPPARIAMQLSNIDPYVSIGGARFLFPGALKHCLPECGIDFSLTRGSGLTVNTAAVHVKQR